MTYCCLYYICFRLGKLCLKAKDKKWIRAIFLFEFKMCHKAPEITHNINNTFGPGTANEHTMQCGSSLAKETRALKTRSTVAVHWKLTMTNLEKLTKNSTSTILQSFSIWCKLESWKSSVNGCCVSWPKIKKNCWFEVLSTRILCNNNEPFLDLIVTWDRKWILYNHQCQTTQWLDQEEAPKHFPKPNLHHKKVMVTVLWSADCLIHYSFLNPGKLLPLRSMLSKSVRYTKTATCSQHWSTKRTQFFSTTATAPYHTSHNQCFKSWTDWATKFCLIHRRPDLSPTDYHFFKHLNNFLEGKCFHNQLLLLLLLSCFSRVWLCATP